MISMPATLAATVMPQFPVPPPSNVAISPEPGAVVLFEPPEVVDHFALLLKMALAPVLIQYFVAAWAETGRLSRGRRLIPPMIAARTRVLTVRRGIIERPPCRSLCGVCRVCSSAFSVLSS